MGRIDIDFGGSFEDDTFTAEAEDGGHIYAVRKAIEFLTGKMEEAVAKDVELAKQGRIDFKHFDKM